MTITEERIIDLESRLTFQDDLLQQLDDVIIRQQQDIEAMKLQLNNISQQLAQVSGLGDAGEEQPPPHY